MTYNLAEPEDVLILAQIHFLKFGGKSQPQRSYKNGSYKIKRVYNNKFVISKIGDFFVEIWDHNKDNCYLFNDFVRNICKFLC